MASSALMAAERVNGKSRPKSGPRHRQKRPAASQKLRPGTGTLAAPWRLRLPPPRWPPWAMTRRGFSQIESGSPLKHCGTAPFPLPIRKPQPNPQSRRPSSAIILRLPGLDAVTFHGMLRCLLALLPGAHLPAGPRSPANQAATCDFEASRVAWNHRPRRTLPQMVSIPPGNPRLLLGLLCQRNGK